MPCPCAHLPHLGESAIPDKAPLPTDHSPEAGGGPRA